MNDAEREQLTAIVTKFGGSNQKVRRAQILLKADAEGPGWTDHQIAEAFGFPTKTVENVRQRLVEFGFSSCDGHAMVDGATPLSHVVAIWFGDCRNGIAPWTLAWSGAQVLCLCDY